MKISFILICAVNTALLTQNNMLHMYTRKNIIIYCPNLGKIPSLSYLSNGKWQITSEIWYFTTIYFPLYVNKGPCFHQPWIMPPFSWHDCHMLWWSSKTQKVPTVGCFSRYSKRSLGQTGCFRPISSRSGINLLSPNLFPINPVPNTAYEPPNTLGTVTNHVQDDSH